MALRVICFALVAFGCGGSRDLIQPDYEPTKAPTEALIDQCTNHVEEQEVRCPLRVFLSGVYNFADLWDYSQKCKARLTACEKFGAVDRAEMQGKINEQAARADRNAKWIWIVAGVGGVLTVVSFLVGAFAL
jgi:hypothetical protein